MHNAAINTTHIRIWLYTGNHVFVQCIDCVTISSNGAHAGSDLVCWWQYNYIQSHMLVVPLVLHYAGGNTMLAHQPWHVPQALPNVQAARLPPPRPSAGH